MYSPGSRSLLLLALAAAAFGASAAHAQAARITGTIRDAQGGAISGARVTATNATTGGARSATTTAAGTYTISGLAAGNYTVSASAFGYRRVTRTAVDVSTSTTQDFSLDRLALQGITVTATLREQELADIPFSIAAPSASVLRERGAENLEMIAANVASFSVQNLGPGQNQVSMRGASAGQIARDQPGVKEQVGAYLDDSPISLSLFTPDLDLFDISRVEVLRGPQGTLFGAGSLSGTVRYITNQPELGVNSSFGEIGTNYISGGNTGADVKVGTNVPMGDKAAGRLALYHNRIAGWMDAVQPNRNAFSIHDNDNTGSRTGVRAAVLIAPNQQLSITPRIVFQKVEMNGWNRIDTFNILANPYTTSRPATAIGEREHFTQIGEPFTDDFVLGDVNVGYSFGKLNLTSVSSYADRKILVVRDAGALTASITGGSIGLPEDVYTLPAPLDDATNVHVFTQELRLAGSTTRTKWLLGAFYTGNKRGYGQSLLVSGFQAATGIPTEGLRAARDVLFFSDLFYDLRQTALFGEGTLNAGKLDLTAGLRYYNFKEDRDQVFDGIFGNDNTGTSLVSVPGSTKADGIAPRFIASYKANDRITLNAQAAKGFRLGGINDPLNVPLCTQADLATFSGRDSWKDETAWNYEVGTKTSWLNGRAGLNLSAFYMDIRDLQLIVTAGSCSSRLVFNVPKAVSQGVELEVNAAPNNYVDVSLSTTLNKAELRSTLTSTDAGGNVSVVAGIEDGNRLPSVPEVQGAVALTLHRPLRGGAQGFFTTTFNYIGDHFTQIDDFGSGVCAPGVTPCPFGTVDMTLFAAQGGATIGGPLTQNTFTFNPLLPAYSLLNLRAGLTRGNWETAVYLNNLTDKRALLALDRERGTRARVGYLTNQPRTAGVTLRFNY